ncbi:MAG: chromosomal replication initiator protein DnaA [Anaerolineae bacterium]
MTSESRSPADLWQTALGELQLQLPRETFNTWLRSARLLAHEDGTFIIGVQNIYAREWLEHRLKRVIVRTLSQVARRSAEVRFVLWSGAARHETDLGEAGPLLAELAPKQAAAPAFEHLPAGDAGLNRRQTFENYAVGGCNRLAYAAAVAVVEDPAMQFNPLYIYGGVGLGKTHLLHAIGNACLERGGKVLYITAETFTNDLVAAIRTRSTVDLREKYRSVDILLIDDIQFIAGKDSTQEEFYHTFNELYNANAQIIIAGSHPPDAIEGLDPRLCSRFKGGLVVEIQPPDFLTRVDILEIKARLRGFEERLSLDVLEAIAERAQGSVRELEGALNRVIAQLMLTPDQPSLASVDEALAQLPRTRPALELPDIIMAVADFYGIRPEDIIGRGRSREVSTARQVVMYLAREEADCSLQQIGEELGGRSHSTVLYSCERVADLMATDSLLKRQVRVILQSLRPAEAEEQPHRE